MGDEIFGSIGIRNHTVWDVLNVGGITRSSPLLHDNNRRVRVGPLLGQDKVAHHRGAFIVRRKLADLAARPRLVPSGPSTAQRVCDIEPWLVSMLLLWMAILEDSELKAASGFRKSYLAAEYNNTRNSRIWNFS